jgi:hypothetical protein
MATISSPTALDGYLVRKVDFEGIAGKDGEEFGFAAGQPYQGIGLKIFAASVSSGAGLNSPSKGVAARSEAIYAGEHGNALFLRFSTPQQAVGLFYRDTLATSVRLRAAGDGGNTLEEGVFQAGEGYAGFVRDQPDITEITVYSPHATYAAAASSRTYVDDLAFAQRGKGWLRFPTRPTLLRLTWAWTILVGYILLTPVGPLCIVCASPIAVSWTRLLGLGALVLGGLALWSGLTRDRR